MAERKIQTAYEHAATGPGKVPDRGYAAMYTYLTGDLGRDSEWARKRASDEAARRPAARWCDELEESGVRFSGRKILDLGAGLGALTTEIASRGGWVVAIEPGEGWRKIAAARLAEAGCGQVLGAVGEFLPIASQSIDIVVSLQVLEHVQRPPDVIRELYRVLKPGGQLFLTYENYLSFREPHYGVCWLPLLPKSLGAAYLRLRGRNPQFLLESVTYTTFPAVRREMLRSGFECMRREAWLAKLRSAGPAGSKWRLLRLLSGKDGGIALRLLSYADFARRAFRTFTEECMRKPDASPGTE